MSYIGNPIISTDFPIDYGSGNGSTTAFTLSIAPASVNAISVAISGVAQSPKTYTISGTTLTFSTAPPTGTDNIVIEHKGVAGIPNVPSAASVGTSALSATGTPSASTFLRGDNTWASVARSNLPTGSVLQVVSVTDTTQYTYSNGSANQTTYQNVTNLVASITPSSSSNKILVLADICASQASNSYNAFFRTTRNGTVIGVGNSSGYNGTSTSALRTSDGGELGTVGINYLDSPSSTSAVTYQIQICNSGGSSAYSYVNRPANGNTGWEQTGASTITLMEIAG